MIDHMKPFFESLKETARLYEERSKMILRCLNLTVDSDGGHYVTVAVEAPDDAALEQEG